MDKGPTLNLLVMLCGALATFGWCFTKSNRSKYSLLRRRIVFSMGVLAVGIVVMTIFNPQFPFDHLLGIAFLIGGCAPMLEWGKLGGSK